MRSRVSRDRPVSFFAFQDIITSIIGIFVLCTLVLAIALISRKQYEPQFQTEDLIARVGSEVGELEELVEGLRKVASKDSQELQYLATLLPNEIQRELDALQSDVAHLQGSISRLRKRKSKLSEQKTKTQQLVRDTMKADQQRIEDVERQITDAQAKLVRLRKSNRMIYNIAHTDKTAWLVEISNREIVVARAGESEAETDH